MISHHEFSHETPEIFQSLPVAYGETLRDPESTSPISGNTSQSPSLAKVYDWLDPTPDIPSEQWQLQERQRANLRLELLYRALTTQSRINIALAMPEHGTTIARVDDTPESYRHTIAPADRLKADILLTETDNTALVFNPADCPIVNLAFYRHGLVDAIAQIHAGAKGIASDVVGKTLRSFAEQGLDSASAVAYVSPHGQTYTLYGPPLDNAHANGLSPYLSSTATPGHERFDMTTAVTDQLTEAGVPADQIQASLLNTLDDPHYYSQRVQSTQATASQSENPAIPPFARNGIMFVKK